MSARLSRWPFPALLALTLAVGAPAAVLETSAAASVVLPLDLPSLVGRADRIVVGRVEGQEARWTSDHRAIYTDVTVRVGESWKGDSRPGDVVVVRREGGEVDGVGMKVIGAAVFAPGEEAVLFLERRGAALWTVGMAQGKLRVETVDGRRMAYHYVAGLEGAANEPAVRPLADIARAVAAEVRRAGERR